MNPLTILDTPINLRHRFLILAPSLVADTNFLLGLGNDHCGVGALRNHAVGSTSLATATFLATVCISDCNSLYTDIRAPR
jgi:hypothetical protein